MVWPKLTIESVVIIGGIVVMVVVNCFDIHEEHPVPQFARTYTLYNVFGVSPVIIWFGLEIVSVFPVISKVKRLPVFYHR